MPNDPRRIRLTDSTVRALPPPAQGQATHWDATLPGFGLRIAAGGSRAWVVMYREQRGRKVRRMTLGHYPLLGLADARAKARETLAAVVQGADPAGAREQERGAATFAQVVEAYVELHAKPRKRSWRKDVYMFQRYIPADWNGRKAKDIARQDVLMLLDRLRLKTPVQANRVLALLRKAFNFAVAREFVVVNPCQAIERPTREQSRDRVLDATEIRKVWSALDAEKGRPGALFRLALLTAQRGGELRTMRWDDLDLTEGWWTVPSARTKNGLAHRVPLSPSALAILNQLHEDAGPSPWVFPTGRSDTDGPLTTVQKLTARVCKRSGVDFQPHDFRRTAATHMAGAGVSRLVIQKILNHVEHGVTAVYERHSYDAEKRAALVAWGARLGQIVSGDAARAKVVALRA